MASSSDVLIYILFEADKYNTLPTESLVDEI